MRNKRRDFYIRRNKKIMRQLIKRNKAKKRKSSIKHLNGISYKSSLFNFLFKNNFSAFIKNRKKEVRIRIPSHFSFISNPNDTIKVLKEIVYCLNNSNVKRIVFDYSLCEEIGICASVVLDVIVMEAKKIRRDIILSGNYPNSIEAKLIFCISGLVKHLGLSDLEIDSVRRLEILSNLESDTMSEKVVEYYDDCLKTQGYMLSEVGKSNFANMVGEVIDNAEQYSGDFKSWHVLGHFNIQPGKSNGKCRLVLMNFGNSIYDSLKDDKTTEYTKKLLLNHTQKVKKMFDFGFNEEVLWTLYSLQQNVSKSRNSRDGDRGNGTIRMLKAFSEIGETIDGEKPKMSIVSGNSYLLLDGTYNLKEEIIDNKKVSVIAFNESNSLDKLPDRKYVQILKNKFPGTIISLEFYLDNNYMNKVLRGE